MSALSAIEAQVVAGPESADADGSGFEGRQRRLVVVGRVVAAEAASSAGRAGGAGKPRSSSIRPPARSCPVAAPAGPARARTMRPVARAERSPIRLTRRGKAVVAGLVVTGLTVLALLVTLLASSGAEATNHGRPGAGYQGMREVVVRPGQTLWSIASAAEPTADPRIVIQEIMTANALTSTDIASGQLLWVPR
jgi:LysM domain